MEKNYQIAVLHTKYSDGSKKWTIAVGPGNFAHAQVKITAKAAKQFMKDLGMKFSHMTSIQGAQTTYHK